MDEYIKKQLQQNGSGITTLFRQVRSAGGFTNYSDMIIFYSIINSRAELGFKDSKRVIRNSFKKCVDPEDYNSKDKGVILRDIYKRYSTNFCA